MCLLVVVLIGRIVELSCLYCNLIILFIVILQGKGNYIFKLVPSINPVPTIPTCLFFCTSNTLTQTG